MHVSGLKTHKMSRKHRKKLAEELIHYRDKNIDIFKEIIGEQEGSSKNYSSNSSGTPTSESSGDKTYW